MYKKGVYTIEDNRALNDDVYLMRLVGDTQYITSSGQFINIAIEGLYLRRPISVCDYDESSITIIYKVVGEGTERMNRMVVGDTLECLTGLGNGFSVDVGASRPLLIGGGVGVPPLYNLAKRLIAKGCTVQVVLGFGSKAEIFFEDEFRALGCEVYISTVNGDAGTKGFVTDAIKENNLQFDYYYTCGPTPMLKALSESLEQQGELSFEERMGCGFGVCMGCTCKTKYGAKRICREGPVVKSEEVVW